MPLAAAIIPAVIGAGAAVYSAGQQKKAAGKALTAETAANDKALAAQQANLDRIAGLQQPYVQAGYGALDAIMARYGLGSHAAAPAQAGGAGKTPGGFAGTSPMEAPPVGTAVKPPRSAQGDPNLLNGGINDVGHPGGPVAPQTGFAQSPGAPAATGGQPDYAAYGAANPDLQAEWQNIVATGNAGNDKFNNDPNAYYAWHYANHGQAEGRDLPTSGGSPAPDPTASAAAGAPAGTTGDQGPVYDPTPTYTRPDQPQWQDMGSGPDSASYLDPSKFQADPSYAWRQAEAARGGNASFGARGLLKSGGAIKAAQDRSFHLADTAYNDWYQQQLARLNSDRNQFNTNRSTDFNIFRTNRDNTNANFDTDSTRDLTQHNNDRSFTAQQDQQRIGNLFALTGVGTSAAGATGAASSNYANNAGNIFGNQASAIGNAADSRASANAGAVGAIGGAAANIFSRYAAPSVAAGSGSTNTGAWTGAMGNWGF